MSATLRIRKIGIALAAYKPPVEVFAEQLRTIREQSFTDWVCVITCDSPLAEFIDDPRLKPYRSDARFVWIENRERLGHKKNFEKAIQECVKLGVDAIACSDQDDLWYAAKLETCARALEAAGPLSLVHSDMHVLDGERLLEQTAWQIEHRGVQNVSPMHLMIRNVVAGCSMLFDAELARRFPRIPAEAEFHDHWYALVASAHGGVHSIPQPLYAYRQHPTNVVGVSPYHSVFWMPKGLTPAQFVEKCRKGWAKSRTLAEAARREGVPVPPAQLSLFLSKRDLGTGVLALGIAHLRDDRPLLRACLARGLGKALAKF